VSRLRRDKLRQRLRDAGLDALLVTKLVNVRYLTGFTGSAGRLLALADGDEVLVTDGRYRSQVAAQAPDVTALIVPPAGWLATKVGARRRLGLESDAVPWDQARSVAAALPGVEVVPAAGHVEALRQVKDDDELRALRRACQIGDEAFADLLEWVRPGMTEREIGRRLDRTMVDIGASAPSFETIVASGPNSAIPHHRPSDRVLAAGDLLKLDFGALVAGYHSDMTRMVALGQPPPRLREVFDVVLAAQAAGLAAVGDGAATPDVDGACRRVIADAGYADLFVHGTGHGVGLEIHEDPYLRPTEAVGAAAPGVAVTLRDRMTVTVEPGVYVEGLGGVRIEDSLVVAAGGADVLTTTPKELVIL
jgi:Xaa-Pro aminopeptidase